MKFQKELNKNINKYINHYLTISSPNFAVLLKGKWGCGKTYFIKNIIKTINDKLLYINFQIDKKILKKS